MSINTTRTIGVALVFLVIAGQGASVTVARGAPTEVPASITTPDTVETRIGTLQFKDGYLSASGVGQGAGTTILADFRL